MARSRRSWSELLVASLVLLSACDAPASAIDGGGVDAARARVDAGAEPATDASAADASGDASTDGGTSAALAIFRTPDVNAVCGPTPPDPCTPGDAAWLASEYGSVVRRPEPSDVDDAGLVYRVVALIEREGPSSIDVFVLDEDGGPLRDVALGFYFSSAPDPSRADEWYPVRVTTRTGADGRAGFSLAASAYLSTCGGGGPHAIWVSEPREADAARSVPSDLADRLGMLGGTNHRHLDILYQRVTRGRVPSDVVRCPL